MWFQGHPPVPDPTSYSQVQQALQDKVGACLEWESAREVCMTVYEFGREHGGRVGRVP